MLETVVHRVIVLENQENQKDSGSRPVLEAENKGPKVILQNQQLSPPKVCY